MLNLQVQCISDKVQHTPTIILLRKGKFVKSSTGRLPWWHVYFWRVIIPWKPLVVNTTSADPLRLWVSMEEWKKKRDWQGKGNREISFPSLTQSRLKLKSSSPNLGKSSLLYLSSAFTFLLKLDLIWSYQFENQCVNLASRMVTRHFYYILNMVLALLQSLLAFSKSAYLLRAPSRKCDVLSKPFGWCLSQTLLPSAANSFHWLIFIFFFKILVKL